MAWSDPRDWSTDEVVTAAHLNQEIRDNLDALAPGGVEATSWTPDLEDSSGTVPMSSTTGAYYRLGAVVFAWCRFVLEPTVATSGAFKVDLPVAASGISASNTAHNGQIIGAWQARDTANVQNNTHGPVQLGTDGTIRFVLPDSGGVVTGPSTPFIFSSGDTISFHVQYPAA